MLHVDLFNEWVLCLVILLVGVGQSIITTTSEPISPHTPHTHHPRTAAVAAQGYIDDYKGVRVSSTGKRFMIKQCIVWEVIDADGVRRGQAATFADVEPLPKKC